MDKGVQNGEPSNVLCFVCGDAEDGNVRSAIVEVKVSNRPVNVGLVDDFDDLCCLVLFQRDVVQLGLKGLDRRLLLFETRTVGTRMRLNHGDVVGGDHELVGVLD